MKEFLLDTYIDRVVTNTTGLTLDIQNDRLHIVLDDGVDYVQGYFRNIDDIKLMIKELEKYMGRSNG